MRLVSTLLSVVAATGALAVPTKRDLSSAVPVETHDLVARQASAFTATPINGCLQPAQAVEIITAFNYLLANPTAPNFAATADALLANDWEDISDSINQLAGLPEGSVTFPNKAAFISSSSKQPPLYLETQDWFNSCTQIAWLWISVSGTGDNAEKVRGLDAFYINPLGQIEATSAEFNSGAWLADLGKPECSSKKE